MVKVFVSYRHTPADAEVAGWLAQELAADGHEVFHDSEIPKAHLFDEYIKDRLRGCDVFVIVVSRASKESPWVRAELRVAHQLAQKTQGRPRIVPLVVEEFTEDWPMEWDVILAMIQHVPCLNPERDRRAAVADVKKVLKELAGEGRRPASISAPPADGAAPAGAGLPEPVLGSIRSLLEVAEAHLDRRQFSEARDVLKTCERLADQPLGQAPAAVRARLYNGLALALATLRTLPDALVCAVKARALLSDLDEPVLRRKTSTVWATSTCYAASCTTPLNTSTPPTPWPPTTARRGFAARCRTCSGRPGACWGSWRRRWNITDLVWS